MMILNKFPMPPTINKQLTLSRGRFIKTNAARLYDINVNLYKIKNFKKIEEIKKQINENDILKVNVYFIFHKDRLISKKNLAKQLDVNNYLKSALDGLVKCILHDDKHFFSHHIEKIICDESKDEQIIFEIEKTNYRNFKDLTLCF